MANRHRTQLLSAVLGCFLLSCVLTVGVNVSAARSAPRPSFRVTRNLATFRYFGDLWASTWASDDRLYFSWGDGTGSACAPSLDQVIPGALDAWKGSVEISKKCYAIPQPSFVEPVWTQFCRTFGCPGKQGCYKLCAFTDSGMMVLAGKLPNLQPCDGSDQCIVSRDIPGRPVSLPAGQSRKDDKVSSLLALDGELYYAGHSPSVVPLSSYLAVSKDHGRTWMKLPNSPWAAESHFGVLMFINMGKNFELNRDGYVYALGTPLELDVTLSHPQSLYLARVPKYQIAVYTDYQYLSGFRGDSPSWSSHPEDAIPLPGLSTLATGSATYHKGIGRYLFLAGVDVSAENPKPHGTLYAAARPWGPWKVQGTFDGISISMLISKDAGPRSIYFTSAGGTEPYQLNIGRIDLTDTP